MLCLASSIAFLMSAVMLKCSFWGVGKGTVGDSMISSFLLFPKRRKKQNKWQTGNATEGQKKASTGKTISYVNGHFYQETFCKCVESLRRKKKEKSMKSQMGFPPTGRHSSVFWVAVRGTGPGRLFKLAIGTLNVTSLVGKLELVLSLDWATPDWNHSNWTFTFIALCYPEHSKPQASPKTLFFIMSRKPALKEIPSPRTLFLNPLLNIKDKNLSINPH